MQMKRSRPRIPRISYDARAPGAATFGSGSLRTGLTRSGAASAMGLLRCFATTSSVRRRGYRGMQRSSILGHAARSATVASSREAHDRFFAQFVPAQLAGQSSFMHHERSVGHAEDLFHFAGDEK